QQELPPEHLAGLYTILVVEPLKGHRIAVRVDMLDRAVHKPYTEVRVEHFNRTFEIGRCYKIVLVEKHDVLPAGGIDAPVPVNRLPSVPVELQVPDTTVVEGSAHVRSIVC